MVRALQRTFSLFGLSLGTSVRERVSKHIEPWRSDVEVRPSGAHSIAIRTKVRAFQYQRGGHSGISRNVAGTRDFPALAAPLGHPVAPSQACRNGRRPVVLGAIHIARRGGKHGV